MLTFGAFCVRTLRGFTPINAPFLKRVSRTGHIHSFNRFEVPHSHITRLSSTNTMSTEKGLNPRVALLQFSVSDDKPQNHITARDFVRRAVSSGAELVVLPEIWNGPYATAAFPEYAENLPDVGETFEGNAKWGETCPSAKVLSDLAKEFGIWIVGGSVSERVISSGDPKKENIFNTCLCMNPQGHVVAKHRKVHLFDIDVPGKITFKESDTLSPGGSLTSFDAGPRLGMIGIGICYDIRFPELSQCLVNRGCKILIFPGAFNLTTGPAHWELLQRARAIDNQCYVLAASPARTMPPPEGAKKKYPHYTAWGHSTVVNPWGEVIATTDEKEGIIIVDLDMERVNEVRSSIPTSSQKREDLYNLADLTKS